MNLLKELHNLFEAEVPGENLIELKDLIRHFPNKHKTAIEKLWGGPRLAYNGIPFFSDSSDIYDKADAAVKGWHKDGGEYEVNLSDIVGQGSDGEVSIEINYQENLDPTHDGQEVYMGYDVHEDALYIGYDISLSEEEFNEAWDKAFEDATGESFDYDDPSHHKAFTAARQEWMAIRPWILFKLEKNGDEFNADSFDSGDQGFYPEGHNRAEELGLLDLRLD